MYYAAWQVGLLICVFTYDALNRLLRGLAGPAFQFLSRFLTDSGVELLVYLFGGWRSV
jgi:hypothetical protein